MLVGVARRSSAITRLLFLSSSDADFGVEQVHVSCGAPAGPPGECGPATLGPGNNTLGYVRSAHSLPLREVKVHFGEVSQRSCLVGAQCSKDG